MSKERKTQQTSRLTREALQASFRSVFISIYVCDPSETPPWLELWNDPSDFFVSDGCEEQTVTEQAKNEQ